MEHILADQPALFRFHERLQEVVDHLGVHGPFGAGKRKVMASPPTCAMCYPYSNGVLKLRAAVRVITDSSAGSV